MSWPSSGQMCVVGLSIPPGETSTAQAHPASHIRLADAQESMDESSQRPFNAAGGVECTSPDRKLGLSATSASSITYPAKRRSISKCRNWKATHGTKPVEWGDDAGP